jgi:hypothetical protein
MEAIVSGGNVISVCSEYDEPLSKSSLVGLCPTPPWLDIASYYRRRQITWCDRGRRSSERSVSFISNSEGHAEPDCELKRFGSGITRVPLRRIENVLATRGNGMGYERTDLKRRHNSHNSLFIPIHWGSSGTMDLRIAHDRWRTRRISWGSAFGTK